jgi:hypothetical protein
MIYKRIKDFPPKAVGSYTGEELIIISDTSYNAKTKLSELREFILTGSGLLYSGGEGILNVTGSAFFSSDVTIYGQLNVETINQINVDNLNVLDKTISLNVSGSNTTASGSGIIIRGTDNLSLTDFLYVPSMASKWAANGSQVITSNPTQSLYNKTLISPEISNSTRFNDTSFKFISGSSINIPIDVSYLVVSSSNSSGSLPALTSSNDKFVINIKNASSEDLMISASSGQQIDQYDALTIRYMDSVKLFSDASNGRWWIYEYSAGTPTIII